MNAGRRTLAGINPVLVVAALVVSLLGAWTLTPVTTESAAALTGPSPGTYAGPGFDACEAPSATKMNAWLTSSPFRAVGIYIGGNNRGCPIQANLTPSWVDAQRTAGWHLLPIYMGSQPYCTSSTKQHRFNGANAASTGRAEAGLAVAEARAKGLAAGSTIFSDIEGYNNSTGVDSMSGEPCTTAVTTAVLNYQSAWTARLHDYGFLSGFYSSLGSGVRDQVAVYGSTAYARPDYLWFARYDGVDSVLDTSTTQVLPDSYWVHRRIKQYRGGANETFGGQTVNIDRDRVDVTPVPATAFGDFHGNGWSDLLARQTTTGSLYLYPGNGTGFGSPSRFGGGWNAMSSITRMGDFNRDGHEDVIARESATGALWLYRGTGSGFATRLKIGSGGWNSMREITPVGDLDGDGYPDLLAVQTSTGIMYLYPGRGTSLAPRRTLGGGWNTMSELAGVGDFNRDGRRDLLARNTASGDLWLYKGTGTAVGARILLGTGWNGRRDLTGIGDFDRDGFNDVVAVDSATGQLFRYPGRGTSFGPRLPAGGGWGALQPLL
jgi:hypothetical protein